MGRTVQQTREVVWPRKNFNFEFSTGGGTTTGSTLSPPFLPTFPSQTTNSYRSGSRTEDSYDDSIVSSKSQVDFIDQISKEDRETRGGYDNGHGFWTTKQIVSYHPVSYKGPVTNPDSSGHYVGYAYPRNDFDSVDYFLPVALEPTDMVARGTKAIASTTPINSVGGLAVALGEFYRDGLPHLVSAELLKHKLKQIHKGAADEYLNWEFGYLPLAGDITKALAAVTGASAIVLQYLRDSGRNVRRVRSYPSEITTSSKPIGQCQIGLIGPSQGSNGSERFFLNNSSSKTGTQVDTTKKTYWFSGAYTYHVPGGQDLWSKLNKYSSLVEKVTGDGITPESLWGLQPWSWLSDWIWDLGSVIHNVDAFSTDCLVLRYGYMMCTTEVTRVITHPGAIFANGSPTGPVHVIYRTIRKDRVKSTPYGFGLDPNGFSARKWSILGALGMSKASTSLR